MTVDDVLNYFGTGYRMKKAIGLSSSNIRNWLSYGYIPFDTQIKIERLTNGDLKVNKEDLENEINHIQNGLRGKKSKKFDFSSEHYNKLFDEQKGACAICNLAEKTIDYRSGKIIALAFDYNHITGKPRGLLCGNCNRTLGFLKDNPSLLRNVLHYIEKYEETNTEQ